MPQLARTQTLYEAIEALPEGVIGELIHGQPRLSGPLPRPDLSLDNPVSETVPQLCQALAWQRQWHQPGWTHPEWQDEISAAR